MKPQNKLTFQTIEFDENIVFRRKLLMGLIFLFPVIGGFLACFRPEELCFTVFTISIFSMALITGLYTLLVKRYVEKGYLSIGMFKIVVN